MGSGITIGDILQFSMLLWTIEMPTRQVGWLISEATRCAASIERIREILDAKPDIENGENFIVKDKLQGKIEFRKVNFSYGKDPILSDINLSVKPGQTVALVGPTGSGKSSLINLICRFYDATDGEVLLDDTNIKLIDLKVLRRSISTAMQDIFLFSDTIEENIAYGNPDISHEQVIKVAKIADADNFIHDLPDDYDTIIGERGVGLSGGQKQRIALARALLNDPSILILDDTTSSVDMQTEHEIHKMLGEYLGGRTTIIIAHRISAVRHADQIFVLSDGQIIEHGTHDELIERPREEAYYRSVYENQYGDFDNFYKGGDDNGQK
jgi:ABC-type multidrug transport system, ATPase and permease components